MRVLIYITVFIFHSSLFGQEIKKECFQLKTKHQNIFTKVLQPPLFIGGKHTFQCYIEQYWFSSFVADEILKNSSLYNDTARVCFIVSRYGVMSDLSVTKGRSDSFRKEIYRMIKETACSWSPGNADGRNVDAWIQMDLYFTLTRNEDGLRQKQLSVKYYDYKTND